MERTICVYSNWAVFGLTGLGFLLESGASDSFFVGLVGIGAIIAGFAGHMIINAVYRQPFTLGETVLGLGAFATAVVAFIASWFASVLSPADFAIGLTLLGVLVAGFLVYVTTRYGVAGAFHKFDVIPTARSDPRE